MDIPPESLATQQRLSIEGQDVAVKADPLVTPLDVTLAPPTSHDLRADATRLSDACAVLRDAPVEICPAVLRTLSGQLRAQGWQARLAVRDREGSLNAERPTGGQQRKADRKEWDPHRGSLLGVLRQAKWWRC